MRFALFIICGRHFALRMVNMCKIKKRFFALGMGLLGCLCYGVSDWLMIYGEMTPLGSVSWLTKGITLIPMWRFTLAMALAFPCILFYGIALFPLQNFILNKKDRKIYHYLNTFGLTPWIAIHLFYTMLFVLFAWLHNKGYQEKASAIVETLYHRFSWFVLVGQFVMLPVYLFGFYLQVAGKTIFLKIFSLLKQSW